MMSSIRDEARQTDVAMKLDWWSEAGKDVYNIWGSNRGLQGVHGALVRRVTRSSGAGDADVADDDAEAGGAGTGRTRGGGGGGGGGRDLQTLLAMTMCTLAS